MASKYPLAPEFQSQPVIPMPSNRLLLRAFSWMVKRQGRGFAWGDGVSVKTHRIASRDGSELDVFEIAPKDLSGTAPAILDFHGGGFFLTYAASHLSNAEQYALDARCRVFFPDYRLSTSHPFPAAHEDCFATLEWVHRSADELGVDPARVMLLGDSAGGALAAGVAQEALDRGDTPVCAQILIYPVTDHETQTDSAVAFTDTPLWKTSSNRNMWKVYLRGSEYLRSGGEAPVPPYAAPLHRESFAGLPPAFVEVAEFDPLRDEGRLYAEALASAGVPVEFHEVKGAIHGYNMVEGSPTAEAIYKERMAAIQRFFGQR